MDFEELIEKRKSYRALEPVEITEEFIRKIAYQASRSASCANKQPWRYVFVKSKDVLIRLHEVLSSGNYWAKEASMLIAVFSKKDYDCIAGEREYYLFGTGLATSQLILAIVNQGLVAHPMAGFNEDLAKTILNIPKEMRLITLIAVGKKTENLAKLNEKHIEQEKVKSTRKNFDEFAYIDSYRP